MGRRIRAVAVSLLAIVSMLVVAPAARGGAAADFVSRINAERRARGLRALDVRGDLTSVAQAHAERMAARQRLYHNPSLSGDVDGWRMIGENVGKGASVRQIHRAFMDSAGHRANILQSRFDQVGVGTAVRSGYLYVSEVFVQRGRLRLAPRVVRRPSRSAPRPAIVPAPRRPRRAPPPPPEPEPQTVHVLLRLIEKDADLPFGALRIARR